MSDSSRSILIDFPPNDAGRKARTIHDLHILCQISQSLNFNAKYTNQGTASTPCQYFLTSCSVIPVRKYAAARVLNICGAATNEIIEALIAPKLRT